MSGKSVDECSKRCEKIKEEEEKGGLCVKYMWEAMPESAPLSFY